MSLTTSRLHTILELEQKGVTEYPGAMDRVMRELETAGNVVRIVCPNTGKRHVRLTDSGRRSLDFIFKDK